MPSKAQQRADTTRALVAAAYALFAEHGYARVSLAEIVDRAGVSKGALYHYFTGKDALFRAVLAEAHEEVAARVVAATATGDAWTSLVAGCVEFLTAATDPRLQQVMLIDAPAVLGWAEWRAQDERTSMRHLTEALERLVDEGTIAAQPVAPLVHLLSGAMNEAALWLAGSTDRERDLAATVTTLTRLLDSLRTA